MNKNELYANAREQYAAIGVDTEKVIDTMKKTPVSMHCWQGDDITGFENSGEALSGGIQVTGNYPGKARTMEELRADIEKVFTLTPGTYRVSLHANYADFSGTKKVDRDALLPEHFTSWIDWAKQKGFSLDFNSTFFSHPKSGEMSLSSKDKGIRDFWIEHSKRCRKISEAMGKAQGNACVHNIWVHDGMKDIASDRQGYREILCNSLDEVLSEKISAEYLKDSVESKVFGIASESYVVGSHEFYMGYAMSRNCLLTIDMGHFHPTENVSDKISSVMLFVPEILLHLSRPVRWDSDHVITFNDDMRNMAEEIVRTGKMDKIHLGTDYFDASINRIGAWVLGERATQKSFLYAMLEPHSKLVKYEEEGNYFARLALNEQMKTMPFGEVWDHYCEICGVPTDADIISCVMDYEKNVTSKRG